MELKIGLIGTFSLWSLDSTYCVGVATCSRAIPMVFFLTWDTFGFLTYGTWFYEIPTPLLYHQATVKILSIFCSVSQI